MPLFSLAWYDYTLNGILIFISLVLWLLILIQKGKGGGLAGAFGGAGGSSPFGSKAGDTFTKITLYLAAVWVLVIMINVKTMQEPKVVESNTTDTQTPPAETPGL